MDELETRRRPPKEGAEGRREEEGSEIENPLLQEQQELDSMYRMSTEKKRFQLNGEGGDTVGRSEQRGLSSLAKGVNGTEQYRDYVDQGMDYDVSRLVRDAERMFGSRVKGNLFHAAEEDLEDVRNKSKIEEARLMMASFNEDFENRFDQRVKPVQGHNYSTILNDTTLLGGIQANESINPGMNITMQNEKRGLNKKLGIDESTMLQDSDAKPFLNQSLAGYPLDLDYGAFKMEVRTEATQLMKEAALLSNPRSELSAYLESAKKGRGDRGNTVMSQAEPNPTSVRWKIGKLKG